MPINAELEHLESLSAHADQAELLAWMGTIKNIPEKVFLVHGEKAAMEAYKDKIQDKFGWKCHIPSMHEMVEILL